MSWLSKASLDARMRLAVAAVALLVSAGPAWSADTVKALIGGWYAANEECRGLSDESPRTDAGCDAREAIDRELKTLGWCYGRPGEGAPERGWHACGR